MFRKALVATGLFALLVTTAMADTYLDKVTAIDADKRTITIPVEKKDTTFKVDEKVDVQVQVKVGKRLRVTPMREGLKGIKVGDEVTITTEKKAGEDVVTKIVVIPAAPVEKKKGK
jgi:hypothetical protein